MKRPPEDSEREDRIIMEIVVDAYGEEERAMGWYYSAEAQISFPFTAKCISKRTSSPLKIGDSVKATGLAPADDCGHELMVLIEWNDDTLGVPLVQLQASPASTETTRQFIEDWHYWVARGYEY